MSIITRTGKKCWDRSVIWGMLKNPAYKGQAAFGKTKVGIKLQHIRPQKHSCEQPKDNYSTYSVEKANWIYVKVPNIVDEDVFDIVQEQLAENRKIARTRERGAKHLLQGLIVCKRCRYAYYGSPVRNKRGEKVDHYAYYRCIGRDSYRFGGNKICDNKHIRTDALETAVWEEVKHLLKNPNRVLEEYRRRLSELKKSSWDQKSDLLEKQENKLKRGIARLIDSYAQEYINQEEFEPRIKAMKQSLKTIEEKKKRIFDQKKLKQELTLVVTNLEDFSSNIRSNLDNADWLTKRDIIRTLVKRIEINLEDVNVVFRVKELPNSPGNNREEKKNLQHCWRGINGSIGLRVPHHIKQKKCSEYMRCGKPIHLPQRTIDTAYSIVAQYQTEYRGIVQYYKMAYNLHTLSYLKYVMEVSLVKTLASKYKTTCRKIYRKFGATIENDEGEKRKVIQIRVDRLPSKIPLITHFGAVLLKWNKWVSISDNLIPIWNKRSEIEQRLLAQTCELCKSQEQIEVHHVRKLADLLGKRNTELPEWKKRMIERQRKTLVVCHECHKKIQYGKYDGDSLKR